MDVEQADSSEHLFSSSSYDQIIVNEQFQIITEFNNLYNVPVIYLNFRGH